MMNEDKKYPIVKPSNYVIRKLMKLIDKEFTNGRPTSQFVLFLGSLISSLRHEEHMFLKGEYRNFKFNFTSPNNLVPMFFEETEDGKMIAVKASDVYFECDEKNELITFIKIA